MFFPLLDRGFPCVSIEAAVIFGGHHVTLKKEESKLV